MDQIGWLIPTILIGLVAFLITNIDTLLLLILLFSQPNFHKRQIVTGQYLGFLVIVLVSTIGFFSKFLVPLGWIGLLGVVPIIMGARRMSTLVRKPQRKQEGVAEDTSVQLGVPPSFARVALEPFLSLETYRVMLLTIGNGADNISTYTPLFASGSFIRVIVLISLFFLLLGVWCILGYIVARLRPVASIIELYGNLILPFAYILLGLYIMAQTGTFLLLAQFVKLR